jgi:type IV secretory pathway VirB10-like protein
MCWGHSRSSFQFRLFRQGSQVRTIVVATRRGREIETEIMVVVRRLMAKMEKHGTSKGEFAAFAEVLGQLAREEDSAETVSKVRQFCQAHALTVSQAKSVMKRAFAPDAFDRIEIASAIKPALINPDSFQMVLHLFQNVDDRLNLCHRLGLPDDMAYSETVRLADAPTPPPPPPKKKKVEEEVEEEAETEAEQVHRSGGGSEEEEEDREGRRDARPEAAAAAAGRGEGDEGGAGGAVAEKEKEAREQKKLSTRLDAAEGRKQREREEEEEEEEEGEERGDNQP